MRVAERVLKSMSIERSMGAYKLKKKAHNGQFNQ